MVGIYKIKNKKTNKVYIGQSVSINRRWKEHKRMLSNCKHHSFKLQESYNKYGEDNFEFSIIQLCSKEQLNELEQLYIEKYNAIDNGYNMDYLFMNNITNLQLDNYREKIVSFFKKLKGNNFRFYIDLFDINEYIGLNEKELYYTVKYFGVKNMNKFNVYVDLFNIDNSNILILCDLSLDDKQIDNYIEYTGIGDFNKLLK